MRTLDEIAKDTGTDKSSNGHSYAKYYDFIFDHIRFKEINLLEIGIDKGDSLRMWHKYFPHSEIHGIDIKNGYEYLNEQGIKTHIVDQSIKGELILFAEQYPNYFDIICDDGSHQSEDMVLTFETLFPYLRSGGYYIIEDLLCVFDSRWNKGRNILERIMEMIGEVNMNGKIPNDHICANKKEAVKKYVDTSFFEATIEWTFNACGTTIIKKL
jgi:hypothetical protein